MASSNKYKQRSTKPRPAVKPSKSTGSGDDQTSALNSFGKYLWHLIFLVIAIISVVIIRKLPLNKGWEKNRIERYLQEKKDHGIRNDSTYRANLVHGQEANIISFITKNVTDTSKVFLLPPQYFLLEKAYSPSNANNIFFWTNPSTFKNATLGGLKFVEAGAPDSLVYESDYTLWPRNGNLSLLMLDNEVIKDSVIHTFREKTTFGIFSSTEAQNYLKSINP